MLYFKKNHSVYSVNSYLSSKTKLFSGLRSPLILIHQSKNDTYIVVRETKEGEMSSSTCITSLAVNDHLLPFFTSVSLTGIIFIAKDNNNSMTNLQYLTAVKKNSILAMNALCHPFAILSCLIKQLLLRQNDQQQNDKYYQINRQSNSFFPLVEIIICNMKISKCVCI